MFELIQLNKSTYYIKTPSTNVGLYKLDNKHCILIDTCLSGNITNQLIKTLKNNNIIPKVVLLTHAHVDHYGSCFDIKKEYNVKIGCPTLESVYIENPILNTSLMIPVESYLQSKLPIPKGVSVDFLYDQDYFTFENHKFKLIKLGGHSINHYGIITPDNVIFTGDLFLGTQELKTTKLYYNYNTKLAIDTMHELYKSDYKIYVPSHSNPLTDIKNTIDQNLDYTMSISKKILFLLKQKPSSIDELTGNIINIYKISNDLKKYFFVKTCLMSFLSYLSNTSQVETVFENGVLKFNYIENIKYSYAK